MYFSLSLDELRYFVRYVSIFCLRFKLMQAGTEFAVWSCSTWVREGRVSSPYETPLTKVRVSLAEVVPLLGERFIGVRSSLFALVPFSCGWKMVSMCENSHLIPFLSTKLRGLMCFWLHLGFDVVLLLGQILPALGLGTRDVVSNSHWKQ